LGAAYSCKLGEPERAVAYHRQALDILRDMNNLRSTSRVLDHLGVTYREPGDPQSALDYHQQALYILETKIDNPLRKGKTLFNMVLASERLGNRAQAIEYGKQALKVCETIEGPLAAEVRKRLTEWSAKAE